MKKQQILVVEGEEDLGQAIRCYLEHGGFEVTVVSDGLSGLSDIHSHPPDLIVINEQLDQLSRYEFIRNVRNGNGSASVPILAVVKGRTPTGRVLELGANAVIQIPDNFEALVSTVENLLKVEKTRKGERQAGK
jgi:two-component system OmpR family response regulator